MKEEIIRRFRIDGKMGVMDQIQVKMYVYESSGMLRNVLAIAKIYRYSCDLGVFKLNEKMYIDATSAMWM